MQMSFCLVSTDEDGEYKWDEVKYDNGKWVPTKTKKTKAVDSVFLRQFDEKPASASSKKADSTLAQKAGPAPANTDSPTFET